jgi:mediator of RNA polymerase II transcription subunit 7
MAESGQRNLPTAFAPPPPLWKHFTPDNVRKLEDIKQDASKDRDGNPQKKKWSPAELRALDLPPELRYLVPPELPTESYSVFGELQGVCRGCSRLRKGLAN